MTHIFGLVLYFLLSRLFVLLLMIEGSLVRTIRHTFIIDVGCETPGGGFWFNRSVRRCAYRIAPDFENLTLSIPISGPLFLPINIPILLEKHSMWHKFGAFYQTFLKIYPIYANWALWFLIKRKPISIGSGVCV